MSFSEILDRASRIADVVSIPVIVDADTDYGGPLNVIRTVRDFERTRMSGIQIEDQAWPKKCSHEGGRSPILPATQLAELRFSMAIYPNALTRRFTHAGAEMLKDLKTAGTTAASTPGMLTHRELWSLFEYEKWISTEERLRGS